MGMMYQKNVVKIRTARVMLLVMTVMAILWDLPSISVRAEEGSYPYMIFAASSEDGAIGFQANNAGLNGNVATNGTISYNGTNCNINGSRIEDAGLGMPDLSEKIINNYFTEGTEEHTEDYVVEDININVNIPIEGGGDITLTGNINLNAGIKAEDDIILCGEVKNSGDIVLYSVSGNVIIDSDNVNLNGLVYAPYGEIRMKAMNMNMNNVILIAQKITIEANGINGGMNSSMAQFIGSEYDIIDDEIESENPQDPQEPQNPRDPAEIMEGIIRYEIADGLQDIGEAYYKEIRSIDEIGYSAEGYECVKNQLLLMAEEGIAFTQIEELIHSYDAEIVGYLEQTGDYQIEFYEDKTPEELTALCAALEESSLLSYCDYNLVARTSTNFMTSDAEWDEEWNSELPDGYNWGVELIDMEGALVNAGVIADRTVSSNVANLDNLTPVRMGIIDNAFDEWHPDLRNQFVCTWNNYESIEELRLADSLAENSELKLDHGSHVAGIMAAEYDNGIGISGVCLKPELYGFAMYANMDPEIASLETVMKLKYALNVLIENDVKVINYSMGYYDYAFAATLGETYAVNHLERYEKQISKTLLKLIMSGKDFLIVTAAGNGNNIQFLRYEYGDEQFGYIEKSAYINSISLQEKYANVISSETYGAEHSGADNEVCSYVDARYSNAFTYSQVDAVQNRVIVVGAVNPPTILQTQVFHDLSICSFSNLGDRVDIYAPGEKIWSSAITSATAMENGMGSYLSKGGTSMASPYVAGVAGLAYNVNPSLSATDLKEIICDNARVMFDINVLNAADVIEDVMRTEKYTVSLHVTDENGMDLVGAQVEIRNVTDYWFKLLGAVFTVGAVGNTDYLGTMTTDEEGRIRLNLPAGVRYYVLVNNGDCGKIQEISVYEEDALYHTTYEVEVDPYNENEISAMVMQFRLQEDGSYPEDVVIHFRSGWNNLEGDYICNAAGEDTFMQTTGKGVDCSFPNGAYTAQIERNEQISEYCNVICCNGRAYYGFRLQ